MKPIFKMSEEVRLLLRLFKEMSINDPVSYEDASIIVGFNIKNCLPAYYSARRVAERDLNIVIEGIRSFGFIKLPGSLIPDVGVRDMKKMRRQALRAAHRQEIAITSSNLTREQFILASELYARFKLVSDTMKPITNRPKPPVPEITYEKDSRENLKKI
jgi:hypothetical protein